MTIPAELDLSVNAPRTIRNIVVGITGGIAAYKSAELVRLLTKQGIQVQVVMTAAAREFITPITMQALSGRSVLSDLWDGAAQNGMAHIDASRDADAILIAPASADFLAKLTHGVADDLLSTLCLARTCPLLVAPAMNRQMWENPATRRNVAQLRRDGIEIFGPAAGEQACGEVGFGRMLEPEDLVQALEIWAAPKILPGKRVLITAGPTFERIDAVRGITNLSSGRMGFAVAKAALEAGASVTLVAGPCVQPTPPGAERVDVVSAQEMLEAVEARVENCDVFISVAAVADYYVLNQSEHKIKKDAHILTLELAPNPDILANVARRPNAPFCVGFAAESENLLEYAEAKRRKKGIPLLVANLIQEALGAEESQLILVEADQVTPLPKRNKLLQARTLIARVAELYRDAE